LRIARTDRHAKSPTGIRGTTNRYALLRSLMTKVELVVVVSELVGYVVGPLELAKGEGRRHEQV
jgi:hypothetical protein